MIKPYRSTLADQFRARPKKGTEGSRLERLEVQVKNSNGREMIQAVSELGYHMAGLLARMEELGLASYERGNPAKGPTSIVARKAAAKAKLTTIDPSLTTVEKLS